MRPAPATVLVDTNAIIEAVRTGTWKALLGGRSVETVQECYDETQRGNPHRPSYVVVAPGGLQGLKAIHEVDDEARAALVLACTNAVGLHNGERDLLAHALARREAGDEIWVVCSPDIACVHVAVALGMGDQTISLEELLASVGAKGAKPLGDHFTARWLSAERTKALLKV